jgi:phosphoribosylformylglycinamidine synthase subunit PurSL
MISRIYVVGKDGAKRADSYLVDSKLSKKELVKLAEALTNPILEEYSIDQSPRVGGFSYAVEIGYLPGVTDNVAHTVKEMAKDLLKVNNVEIYTSKIFFTNNKSIVGELYNPLIERAVVVPVKNMKINLPSKAPKVVLPKRKPVINVGLNVSDEELIKISKEGIKNEDGTRRGPLALDLASMHTIRNYFTKLKRDPADIELESLAQTWSEHCKHTIFANPIGEIKDGLYKTYIKGATNLIRKRKIQSGKPDFCLSVFSDNAGGIVFDQKYLIAHKVETHNSPSALDPYGGAITGIVGVNRDVIGFGLGAKPVANTYGFCFGEPRDERPLYRDRAQKQKMLSPARIMEGVIKGINVGGNCSGIPTVSGFMRFDERFRGKPLVFAGTVGLMPREENGRKLYQKRARAGDLIVVIGGRVGADGIHGATFSSVTIDSNSPATAVQIGDPITQKKFSDAVVKEARAMNLYNSITDNGAGGFSSSVSEMAKECGGAKIDLEKVPLKYPGLRPWEIWISESQERMTLAVPKSKWKTFRTLMESRGVEATVIGEFTNSNKVVVNFHGKKIMDMDMEFLHNGLPKHHLELTPYYHYHQEPSLPKESSRTEVLEKLLGSMNLAGSAFLSEQYDHEVQASSVLKPLSGPGRINTDAQVFAPVLSSNKGVVLSGALYPSYSDISTYHMAACAIDTAIRNSIACGGKLSHLAILDNFCWSSSNDRTRLAELVDAVKACYDYAVGYSTPFISGKDSMFNDFTGYDDKGKPIKISVPPTLLISTIGVLPDINKTVSPEFKNAGDLIYLLGETNDELGASEYYKMLGSIGNNVPMVDLNKNLKTYQALERAIAEELLASSLSVTSGGFSIALAKAAVGGMLGANVSLKDLPGNATGVDSKLFSESQGRILVSVAPKNVPPFEKIIKNIPHTKLGKVSKDGKVVVADGKHKIVDTNVKKLYGIYHKFSNSQK